MIQQKHIILFTITAFLFMSLPHFNSEDMSRNGKIDLEDAVMLVIEFANTAQKPAEFESGVKNAVSALRVTAGLKTVIKKSGSTESALSNPDITGIISSYKYPIIYSGSLYISERTFTGKSIVINPEEPPPRYG